VLRQFAYNTDPGTPPATAKVLYSLQTGLCCLVPEQQKYTTALTIRLRPIRRDRKIPTSLSPHCAVISRCHPWRDVPRPRAPTPITMIISSASTPNITQLKVDYVAQRKLLTMGEVNLPQEIFQQASICRSAGRSLRWENGKSATSMRSA